MEFIRKGRLCIEHGATLSDLFNQRHISDYEAYAFRDASSVENTCIDFMRLVKI